jgi:hypothetical protein
VDYQQQKIRKSRQIEVRHVKSEDGQQLIILQALNIFSRIKAALTSNSRSFDEMESSYQDQLMGPHLVDKFLLS